MIRQKSRESILARLQQSWDLGAENVAVNGPYFLKEASNMIHAALRQAVYATIQRNEENHSFNG